MSLSSGEPAGPPHEIGEMPKKTKYVEDIKWRPHSREFAALTTGGRVFVFESPDFKTIASDMILLHGWRLAYSPDGRLLAAGKSTTSEDFDPAPPDAGNIAIVDSQTLSLIGSKRLAKYTQVVTHIAFLNNADVVLQHLSGRLLSGCRTPRAIRTTVVLQLSSSLQSAACFSRWERPGHSRWARCDPAAPSMTSGFSPSALRSRQRSGNQLHVVSCKVQKPVVQPRTKSFGASVVSFGCKGWPSAFRGTSTRNHAPEQPRIA